MTDASPSGHDRGNAPRYWPPGLPRTLDVPACTLPDNLARGAAAHPQRRAVVFGDQVISYAQLLAQGGLYARLWAHQSGGFLGEEADDAELAASAAA